MRIPTVQIQQARTGKTLIVNEEDYARNLGPNGKYSGWRLAGGETHGDEAPPEVASIPETTPEPTEDEPTDEYTSDEDAGSDDPDTDGYGTDSEDGDDTDFTI